MHSKLPPKHDSKLLSMLCGALLACLALTMLGGVAVAAEPEGSASARAAAPKVVVGKTAPATRAGVVAVALRNPRPYPLAVTVRLRADAGVVATKRLRIAAKATKTAKLRLDRERRLELAARKSLRLKLTVTASRPGGKGRTTTLGLKVVERGAKPGGPSKPAPQPPGFDGTYAESTGWTMVVDGGQVVSFSGTLSLYCTRAGRQKTVSFSMASDDPRPTVAADGSVAWEAMTNYGFVKLKYTARLQGDTVTGNAVVEDRSPLLGTGRIEFDYCFAGRDFTLTRQAAAASASSSKATKKAAPARWKFAKVTLDGWSKHRLADEEGSFEADGRVEYRTQGALSSKPFSFGRRGGPAVAATASGVLWAAETRASILVREDSWDCSHAQPAQKAGLAGAFSVKGKQVRVQWSLAPTFLRCPSGAPSWSFPGMPLEAMTSSFPTKLLNGRVARIPIEIQHRWQDEAGDNEIHWDGTVVLRRVR